MVSAHEKLTFLTGMFFKLKARLTGIRHSTNSDLLYIYYVLLVLNIVVYPGAKVEIVPQLSLFVSLIQVQFHAVKSVM